MIIAISIVIILLIYILTHKISVCIVNDGTWRVDIYFTLCTIPFKKTFKKGSSKSPESSDKKASKTMILRHALDALTHAELEIKRLYIPLITADDTAARAILAPLKYHSIICALLTLIRTRTKKLSINDNAITLIPDGQDILIDISITARLFRIILTYFAILLDKKYEKRKGVSAS